MNTNQYQGDFPEVETAIYRVALSLDSFLLNGIPYGVIQRAVFNGFLEKTARNLLTELAILEQQALHIPVAGQTKVREVLAALRPRCQQLIDHVTGLSLFRTFPLERVYSLVSQVPLLREECVRLIQELECSYRVPKSFYESRPDYSTATINDFLTNLQCLFAEEWAASAEKHKDAASQL